MDILNPDNLQTVISEMAKELRTRTDLTDEARKQAAYTINQLIKLKAIMLK